METGLIDRFRSLPMSRAAVLTARTIADLFTQVIGGVVIALVGLAIGWRIDNGAGDAIEAFALALLFGYAFTWVGVCLGMVLRSPEAAQQTGFIIFLPLTFISSAFVPTQSMPGWLQPVAEWNPMSSLAAACRQLFGNPNPAALVHAWPAQHPELAVVCWSLALLVISPRSPSACTATRCAETQVSRESDVHNGHSRYSGTDAHVGDRDGPLGRRRSAGNTSGDGSWVKPAHIRPRPREASPHAIPGGGEHYGACGMQLSKLAAGRGGRRARHARRLALAALCTLLFLTFLDNTVV